MTDTSTRRRRRLPLLIGGAVLVVVALAAVAWALRGDEPQRVDAERALEQEGDGAPTAEEPAEPAPDEEPDAEEGLLPADPLDDPENGRELEIDGTWTVDTDRPFDRAEGRGSFVGYRIQEELANIGANVAVGRSPTVDGTVAIAERTVTAVLIEADLEPLESDDGRRDNRVRGSLGPDATAAFELTEPIALPEVPPVGEVVELQAVGALTILDVTEEVVVDLQAVVTAEGIVVTGSIDVLLSDFGVEVPTAPIVLSVSDEATLEWQLFLVRER